MIRPIRLGFVAAGLWLVAYGASAQPARNYSPVTDARLESPEFAGGTGERVAVWLFGVAVDSGRQSHCGGRERNVLTAGLRLEDR
jgi:hypothetical protein